MNFKRAIHDLLEAGMTETSIARALSGRGVGCTQSTVNKLKHGSISDPRYRLGSALRDLHQEIVVRGHPPRNSTAAHPPPVSQQ